MERSASFTDAANSSCDSSAAGSGAETATRSPSSRAAFSAARDVIDCSLLQNSANLNNTVHLGRM
jgi:hypothetical protein